MIVRSLGALCVTVVLAACASEVPETVRDGHVRQQVDYVQYRVEPRLDVILVVNTGKTGVGASLRENVTKGLQERARALAEGERPWLRHLWNPLDVRGFVASSEERSLAHRHSSHALRSSRWNGHGGPSARAVRFGDASPTRQPRFPP
jgi:hypothetical protein